jgi:hypothetical protein
MSSSKSDAASTIEEANKFFAKASIKDFFIAESTESSCIENYLNSI